MVTRQTLSFDLQTSGDKADRIEVKPSGGAIKQTYIAGDALDADGDVVGQYYETCEMQEISGSSPKTFLSHCDVTIELDEGLLFLRSFGEAAKAAKKRQVGDGAVAVIGGTGLFRGAINDAFRQALWRCSSAAAPR